MMVIYNFLWYILSYITVHKNEVYEPVSEKKVYGLDKIKEEVAPKK